MWQYFQGNNRLEAAWVVAAGRKKAASAAKVGDLPAKNRGSPALA